MECPAQMPDASAKAPGGFRFDVFSGLPIGGSFDNYHGLYEINQRKVPSVGCALGGNIPLGSHCYAYAGARFLMVSSVFALSVDLNKYPDLHVSQKIDERIGSSLYSVGPRIAFGRCFSAKRTKAFLEVGTALNMYQDIGLRSQGFIALDSIPGTSSTSKSLQYFSYVYRTHLFKNAYMPSFDFSIGKIIRLTSWAKLKVALHLNYCKRNIAFGSYITFAKTALQHNGYFTISANYLGISASVILGKERKMKSEVSKG